VLPQLTAAVLSLWSFPANYVARLSAEAVTYSSGTGNAMLEFVVFADSDSGGDPNTAIGSVASAAVAYVADTYRKNAFVFTSTPAAGDAVRFAIVRDGTNVSDTLSENVSVNGVKISYLGKIF
jgi:hypothetical protein